MRAVDLSTLERVQIELYAMRLCTSMLLRLRDALRISLHLKSQWSEESSSTKQKGNSNLAAFIDFKFNSPETRSKQLCNHSDVVSGRQYTPIPRFTYSARR